VAILPKNNGRIYHDIFGARCLYVRNARSCHRKTVSSYRSEDRNVRDAEMTSDIYITPDGIHVTLEWDTWARHIQARRPDIRKTDLGMALCQPARIYADTSYPDRRVYQGAPRTSGFFRNSFLLVVITLTGEQTGRVVTAFLTQQAYQGRQLWPPLTKT
jgi:hypothetical protein